MLVVVAATKGSPGVTTAALGLARLWRAREPALLLEADPQGGSLAARLAISQEPGLGTLAAAGRHELSVATLAGHAQGGPGGLALVVAPSAPSHAGAALRAVAEVLGQSLAGLGNITVVADVGRLDGASPAMPLADAASRIVFLIQPTLEGTDALAVRLTELGDLRSRVRLVTVGQGTYDGREIGQLLSVPHVGHLPHDPRGSGELWSAPGSAHLPRRPLLRALQSLERQLVEGKEEQPGRPARPADPAPLPVDAAVHHGNRRAAVGHGV